MKFLALLTPSEGKTRRDLEPHIVAEEKAVWAAYLDGTLREMYFQSEPLVVTLVVEAADAHAVEIMLGAFPMVASGLLDRRVIALGPWRPLEALFAAEHRS